MYNFISFPCICQPKNLRNSYGFFLFYTRAQYISRFFCLLEEKFFLRIYLSRFSSASSILRTSSLGRISNASAILHIVEKFACFVPHSIIVRCVRAMPAKPLKTSCDMPFALRTDRIVCPTILFSQSKCITSYYIKVVFIDRSPAECYNKFRMLWIGGTSPTAKTVFGRLQPQLLC